MLRMVKYKGDRGRETRKERDTRKYIGRVVRGRGDRVVPRPMIREGRGLKRDEKGMGRDQWDYG